MSSRLSVSGRRPTSTPESKGVPGPAESPLDHRPSQTGPLLRSCLGSFHPLSPGSLESSRTVPPCSGVRASFWGRGKKNNCFGIYLGLQTWGLWAPPTGSLSPLRPWGGCRCAPFTRLRGVQPHTPARVAASVSRRARLVAPAPSSLHLGGASPSQDLRTQREGGTSCGPGLSLRVSVYTERDLLDPEDGTRQVRAASEPRRTGTKVQYVDVPFVLGTRGLSRRSRVPGPLKR